MFISYLILIYFLLIFDINSCLIFLIVFYTNLLIFFNDFPEQFNYLNCSDSNINNNFNYYNNHFTINITLFFSLFIFFFFASSSSFLWIGWFLQFDYLCNNHDIFSSCCFFFFIQKYFPFINDFSGQFNY